jgi:hypothetical protein
MNFCTTEEAAEHPDVTGSVLGGRKASNYRIAGSNAPLPGVSQRRSRSGAVCAAMERG